MPEVLGVKDQPKKVTIMNQTSREKRIEADEKELAELEAEARGETQEKEVVEANDEDHATEVTEKDSQPSGSSANDDPATTKEEKTFKKRYGDLRRHSQKTEKDLKDKVAALEKRVGGNVEAPAKEEDVKAWMAKYPDVANIITTMAQKEAEKLFKDAKVSLDSLKEVQHNSSLRTAREAIIEVHTDFEKLEESDDFHDWVDEQPKWVQEALFENEDDAPSVVRVLDLYKSDMKAQKKPEEDREAEKAAAASVNTKKGNSQPNPDKVKGEIKESDVDKMDDIEYEKNAEAIDEAIKAGKFVYDMSGGAR